MTNLKFFDAALKISWIKRIATQTEGWAEFPNYFNIQNTIIYGDQYPKTILKTIENKFWRDMVKSLITLISNFTIRNITHLHLIPLWYNSKLDFDFRKTVGDLINEKGELFSKHELKERNLQINVLDYFRLKEKINRYCKNMEKKTPLQGPQIPRLLFEIGTI